MSRVSMNTKEITLREMLAEPIVQTIMARDGVKSEEVEGLMRTARDKAVPKPLRNWDEPFALAWRYPTAQNFIMRRTC